MAEILPIWRKTLSNQSINLRRFESLVLQGAGTRSGKGTCSCDAGYSGEMCDSCTDGHYEEEKNDTHTICKSRLNDCNA